MSIQAKPGKLEPGARIGIVCPSFWIEPERLVTATSMFEELGYEIELGRSTALRENRFAGSADERAADIMAMFRNPQIDAIVCARGGYGGNRVLPLLDYEAIRANPKIFVGYSDVSSVLTSIAQRAKLITFHGPMLTSYVAGATQYNLDTFHDVLSGAPNVVIESTSDCAARVLQRGAASGPAWGGNLALIVERLGTAEQIDTTGAILFLEEIGERFHVFDRMMMQLRNSGSLDNINGLIIGELLEMSDSDPPFGRTLDEIVLDVCSDLTIPIVSNFPCGHGTYQATFPVSHEIELDASGPEPLVRVPVTAVS